jgi:hypothetical protein
MTLYPINVPQTHRKRPLNLRWLIPILLAGFLPLGGFTYKLAAYQYTTGLADRKRVATCTDRETHAVCKREADVP